MARFVSVGYPCPTYYGSMEEIKGFNQSAMGEAIYAGITQRILK